MGRNRWWTIVTAVGVVLSLLGATAAAAPSISFTQVPVCGDGWIEGEVTGIGDASDHEVALYIYRDSWWTKPTFGAPTVPLTPGPPGTATFAADFASHPNDLEAGSIVAVLVPADSTPPQAAGVPSLPRELFSYPYAEATRECDTRVLRAFGRAWLVKASTSPVGPGPNYFSGDPDNVWVDGEGALHLRITSVASKWYAAEVVDISADPARSSPGYGTYTFQVRGDLDALDANVVLGLFTWDSYAPEFAYREIDFEAARWGDPSDPTNAQFVVQPHDFPGHLERFTIAAGDTATTQSFCWEEGRVSFSSWSGNSLEPAPGSEIASYVYEGTDVPPDGGNTANPRMNLWMVLGEPPLNGLETEVVIESFSVTPKGVTAVPGPTPSRGLVLIVRPNPAPRGLTLDVSGGPRGGSVAVSILDVRGRLVRDLGIHDPSGGVGLRWDGRDGTGRRAGPGVFFAVARAETGTAVRRVVLLTGGR